MNYFERHYIEERLSQIDLDFLSYEEENIDSEDKERLLSLLACKDKIPKLENQFNSILLWVTGLSDEFNFERGRSEMIDGSPPDIDIDHDALDREKAIEWCVEHYGREHVSNIITHGTFKPKSLARGYYRVLEGDQESLNALLKSIPPPKYGREATIDEIKEQSPELLEEEKYEDFFSFAETIENLVSTFGIHAAGIIISSFKINDVIPLWRSAKAKAEVISQFDKDEIEELGLIKFDFLGIDTLSIIKECCKLIKQIQDKYIFPYDIKDGDDPAYETLAKGLLTGIFQMETSGMAKGLISKIKPSSIEDLSAISALNRPGPLQAGLDKEYIQNKENGYPPSSMPEILTKILEPSYWTLIYQEQVMDICTQLAGFTLKEADDIRRAMGKKKVEILNDYEKQFIEGSQSNGLETKYAKDLWDQLLGFADYCLTGDSQIIVMNNKGEIASIFLKEIVEKREYGWVLSLNDREEFEFKKIIQYFDRGEKEVYEYTLENGHTFKCTKDHKFLTEQGMIPIQEIHSKQIPLKIYSPK